MILSVVIPTRDKRDLLGRALAALTAQEGLPGDWEVVVVDDGSTDGTAASLAERARAAGSRLRVLTVRPGVGRAAARNLGWRAAAGRWVVFLDDDIVAPPRLLSAHLGLLSRHAGHGTIGRVLTDPALVDAPHFAYLDTRGAARIAAGPVPARYFVTQNAGVPRDALEAAGGFDERFRGWGLEDMELGFRLEERAGLRFLALPAPVPVHAHHHTFAQMLAKRRECGAGALPLLAALHPGRIREMRLHWVVDPPGTAAPGPGVRLARAALEGWPGQALERLLARWPHGAKGPWARALYLRLMNAEFLRCYRQGVVSGSLRS